MRSNYAPEQEAAKKPDPNLPPPKKGVGEVNPFD